MLIIGIALLALGAALVVIVIASSRMRRERREESAPPVSGQSCAAEQETELVANVVLARFAIKLRDTERQDRSWMLPVSDELLIGRAAHCALRLEDKSVSREQCKITLYPEGAVVVNLSASNQTKKNGRIVDGYAPVQAGDVLTLGRESLRIDSLQVLEKPPQEAAQEAPIGRRTESIF